MPTSDRPELDVTPVLNAGYSAYYMSLIGVLRWIIELGQVDVCLETNAISSHMTMPRKVHIESLFYIFIHLKKYHNTEIVFDPSDPDLDLSLFERKD